MKRFFLATVVLLGFFTLSSNAIPKNNNSNICLQKNIVFKNGFARTTWIEVQWDYNGCHYTEDLFINNQGTGGTGFITRKCGKNPSETIQFTITAIHFARVTSIDDIHWDDPLPEDIDNSDFYSFFLDRTNEALAML